MTSVRYVLKGEPRPKQRPRLGRNGNVFTPQQTKLHEEQHGWMWKAAARGRRFESGEVAVDIDFVMGKINPDLDNMVKLVLDGLNKIAWRDDVQVCQITARKRVVHPLDEPSTTVTVTQMEYEYVADEEDEEACDHRG